MENKKGELHTKTLKLLSKSRLSIPDIAKGAGVGQRWLYDFKNDLYPDPGLNKTERLYNWLKRQK